MRRETRAVLLVLLGSAVLHISLFSEQYLRYIRREFRPYLIASGGLLILLGLLGALAAVRGSGREHRNSHGTPRTAWLLALPVLAVYLISPAALGAYTAQRSDGTVAKPADGGFPPLPAGDPLPMRLADFDARAVWDASGSLQGRRVRLTGFATPKPGGGWYLTRLTITCCAADALTSKLEVQGAEAPPEGSWVEVTGVWQPGGPNGAVPVLTANQVRRIAEPGDPYE